jgi:hypothetical protein
MQTIKDLVQASFIVVGKEDANHQRFNEGSI